MLSALSPLDGRYEEKVGILRQYFSEAALIRARLFVEISYFIALSKERGVTDLPRLTAPQKKKLLLLFERFDEKEAQKVKMIERKTRHDVKAVEVYLQKKLQAIPGLKKYTEFVHFGLTSADVNNLAYGILIHQALLNIIRPSLQAFTRDLIRLSRPWKDARLLSLTHGQPATPTTVGKEMQVFIDRLTLQMRQLQAFRMQGKFGGAVGSYAAAKAAYPKMKWEAFGRSFVRSLGLTPLMHTTQINPHDDLAQLAHILFRIDTILLDLSRDMWLYISRGIFRQKVIKGEVGSSTMPHKVNPIDFENAEGNLGLARALYSHFAEKLPISRLQRDLSDSTVQRNIGVAFGYHLLALESLEEGFKRLSLDRKVLQEELTEHPEVIAEAVQTVLRKHGVSGAYEKLKKLTRGERVTMETMEAFLQSLEIPAEEKKRLRRLL